MSRMTGLLYLQLQLLEMKQSRIVPLGMGLKSPFFCLFYILSSPICHSDISAFHEHHPPGPELTQLSSPRGKNLCIPVHLCVDIPVRTQYVFFEDFNTVHLSSAGAPQVQKQRRALLAVAVTD